MPGVAGTSLPPSVKCAGDVQPAANARLNPSCLTITCGGAAPNVRSHRDRRGKVFSRDLGDLRCDVDSCATCAPGMLPRPNNEPLFSSLLCSEPHMSTNLRTLLASSLLATTSLAGACVADSS